MTPAQYRPAVSVALSVYNGERFLKAAIDSVCAQSFTDFEFLILDDGSTDGSLAIIQAAAANDPRIRPIVRDNQGLIASLNQLVREARAPLIARMDADDICLPDRFARQIAFLEANPEYGVVGSFIDDIDENDNPWPCHARPYVTSHEEMLARMAFEEPLLCHPSVMYRRDKVLDVGGYHAAFRHCEDLDLWLRLTAVTKLGNLPETLFRYRHYAEQVTSRHITARYIGATVARIAWMERNAGRADPTAALDELPAVDDLDRLFGREGVARAVRYEVTQGVLYSRDGLRDNGFDLVLGHIAEGGANTHEARARLWRTVARLVRFGEFKRAMRLAGMLVRSPRAWH